MKPRIVNGTSALDAAQQAKANGTHKNGTVVSHGAFAPIAMRIPDPVSIQEPLILPANQEYLKYFADLTNKEKVLQGLHEIFRKERLFLRKNDPDSAYYTQHIDLLQSIVFANKDYFENFKAPVKKNGETSFIDEFIKLRKHESLSEMQKAFLLTEAIFISLHGISPTSVMVRTNQSKISEIKHPDRETELADNTIGSRNEIRVMALLLLFNEDIKSQENIKLSTHIPTYKRKTLRDRTTDVLKMIIKKPAEKFDSEVDILTNNQIVSIKSRYSRLEDPLYKMFFRIVDNPDLRVSTNKLILVRSSDRPEQLTQEYMSTSDGQQLKRTIIHFAKEKLKNSEHPPHLTKTAYQKDINRLISNESVDIFFMPGVDDYDSLQKFMRQHFEQMQTIAV